MKHFLTACLLAALALISGCTGMSGPPKILEPSQDIKEWPERKIVAPSLDSPAKVVKSENEIDKSKFVEVGDFAVGILKKACFKGRCKNYDASRSVLPEILALAADYGATHLVLEQQHFVKKDTVKRDTDRCAKAVGEGYGVTTNYDYGGSYTPGRGVYVKKKGRCIEWAKQSGEGEYVGLRGTAWRYAPQAAAALRKSNNFSVPYVVTDKKTGKCTYHEPLFKTKLFVYDERDVCYPYFWFEDKAHSLEASYYAIASSTDYPYRYGKSHWVLVDTQGLGRWHFLGKAPSCARDNVKCMKEYVKSKFRRGEYAY